MTHNSSVNFKLIFYFGQNCPMKVPILTLSSALVKICQIPLVIFQNHKSIFLQILHHSSVSWKITPLYFLGQTLSTLHNMNQSKCKFVRLLSARVKIHQSCVIFETTSQFFFKFCITLTFLAEILYTFNRRSLSKYKFGDILGEQSKV